jgi:hypothetical protein
MSFPLQRGVKPLLTEPLLQPVSVAGARWREPLLPNAAEVSETELAWLTLRLGFRTVTADTVHLDWRENVGVDEHPFKVVVDATESSPGIPERGWVDMDVRWLVTKDTVGSTKTVFGVTFFPRGRSTKFTDTRTPRRSST